MQLKPIAAMTVLLVVVALSIAGCTGPTTNTTKSNQSNQVEVTATIAQSPQQFNFSTLSPLDKYVQYDVMFANVNERDAQVSCNSFTLLDANQNGYAVVQDVQSNALSHAFPCSKMTTQPGDNVSGRLIYEVPQNATITGLRYFDSTGLNVTVPLGT